VFIYIQIGDINKPFEIDKVEINKIDYINSLYARYLNELLKTTNYKK